MSLLLDHVLETLRRRRDEIEVRHGVRLLGVAGSVARGEERPDSDVDILYKLTGRATFFTLSRLQFELEEAFGRRVDLVNLEGVRPEGRELMEEDLVLA